MKEKEDIILGAEDKAIELEYQLFVKLREHIKTYTERLQQQAKIISELDCLQSFAEIAQKYNYVRPSFSDDKTLHLENSDIQWLRELWIITIMCRTIVV